MPIEAIANVVVGGLLTGLVYGLMALGLSVIYGVVRIVNFAHGEIMTIAMYVAVIAFAATGVDPLWMLVPVAIAFFGFGYLLQRALINPFIDRPEHAQFNQKYGLEYETLTMAETQAFLMSELDRMAVIAKRANIKMD